MNLSLSVCHLVRRSVRCRPALWMLAALSCTVMAKATPVTYTLTGTFSGSLGGVQFTGTPGTFTMLADTSTVTTPDNAFFFNTTGVSRFQLGSMAPVLFLSPTFGVESEYGVASFLNSPTSFAAGEYNGMTPYDVLSASSTTSGMFVSYGPNPELTSGGDLILTGATGDVTFQTSVSPASPPLNPTPEPAAFGLTATGMAGVIFRFLRQRRTV